MKRHIIATLFLMSVYFAVYSQDIFPLQNAKWAGVHITNQGGWPEEAKYTYFNYIIQGDTVVDDITRSKCYYIPNINKTDTLLIGYFHIIENIVYYRIHEISQGVFAKGLYGLCPEYKLDALLYDFSLEEGDVFSRACDWGKMNVTSIEYVEFGGKMRKKIMFNGHDSFYWLEGMGSNDGFFDGIEKIPTSADESSERICFSINNEVLYMNPYYSECPEPKLNSIREINLNGLTIFPNPMQSVATVQSGQPLELIQIYDIAGILVHEQACKGELQTVIRKQSFSQGIYFVKIVLQNGNTQIKKIIIQ